MSRVLINKYLTELAKLRQVGGTHRESVVREAFKDLLKACRALLRPLPGDCCVFCSYGTTRCPPKQSGGSCCGAA